MIGMTNQTIASLTELEDRLLNARRQLEGLRAEAIEERTKIRLDGKIEGVNLALSYLIESVYEEDKKIRVKPTPRPSRGW